MSRPFWVIMLFASLCGTAAADEILLKNGQRFSGKFVRADTTSVEFRILGRVETFKTADISQIVFQEPEMSVPVRAEPAAPPPAAQPAPKSSSGSVTFPVGTILTIRTTSAIDTDKNKIGDAFDAVLEAPLMLGDQIIVPKGAEMTGAIAYAKESGKVSGQSELILELASLKVDGKSYVLRTSDYSEVGASRGQQTVKAAGGGAALGAIIGAIAGGGKGAAVGAATGAAVGTGVQVLTRGQTLRVPAETLLEFKLEHDLVIDKQSQALSDGQVRPGPVS
jgi:hypothetical protein